MLPRQNAFVCAIRFADHSAIGQNQKINARSKRNITLRAPEITGRELWYRDTHRREKRGVLMRQFRQ
jgi:hypothetical protein